MLQREDRVLGSGVFQEMDAGNSPTIKDLVIMMIIVSDNMATDKLLMKVEEQLVQAYMCTLIAGHYDRESINFQDSTENNVSTTRGMNRLMEKIAKGDIFSEAC